MKDSVKVNVKNGLDNIKMWYEIQYNCDYPTTRDILYSYDNEWLVTNLGHIVSGVAEDHGFGYEAMDEKVLVVELDRLRSLKSNQW